MAPRGRVLRGNDGARLSLTSSLTPPYPGSARGSVQSLPDVPFKQSPSSRSREASVSHASLNGSIRDDEDDGGAQTAPERSSEEIDAARTRHVTDLLRAMRVEGPPSISVSADSDGDSDGPYEGVYLARSPSLRTREELALRSADVVSDKVASLPASPGASGPRRRTNAVEVGVRERPRSPFSGGDVDEVASGAETAAAVVEKEAVNSAKGGRSWWSRSELGSTSSPVVAFAPTAVTVPPPALSPALRADSASPTLRVGGGATAGRRSAFRPLATRLSAVLSDDDVDSAEDERAAPSGNSSVSLAEISPLSAAGMSLRASATPHNGRHSEPTVSVTGAMSARSSLSAITGSGKVEGGEGAKRGSDDSLAASLSGSSTTLSRDGSVVIAGHRIVRTLGRGSYSRVYEAANLKTGLRVAMKVLTKHSAEGVEVFNNEYRVNLAVGSHPNIIPLVPPYIHNTKRLSCLFFELCTGGDMFDMIFTRKCVTPSMAVTYFVQLMRAVDHIHGVGVCHLDIKPENMQINASGALVLGDFGLGAMVDSDPPRHARGSTAYAAPELSTRLGPRFSRGSDRDGSVAGNSFTGSMLSSSSGQHLAVSAQPRAVSESSASPVNDGDSRSSDSTPYESPSTSKRQPAPMRQPFDGRKADIWSCGVVFFALLLARIPWDVAADVCPEFLAFRQNGLRTRPFCDMPSFVQLLLGRMLEIEPTRRAAAREIIDALGGTDAQPATG